MDSKKSKLINLRTDLSDGNVYMERLRTWNCQNFSEILNKPKVINIILSMTNM